MRTYLSIFCIFPDPFARPLIAGLYDINAFLYLLLLIFSATPAFSQAEPAYPDNLITPASSIGLPPGVSTARGSEVVNLTNGALNMFIPAITLPQRSGSKPLILGFTYNSNVIGLRQDVSVSLNGAPNPAQYEDNYFYAPYASGSTAPYDVYEYRESITSNVPFYTPLQVNLPILRASIEYEGDAWQIPPYGIGNAPGGGLNIIPQFCVTNFTFTDWAGATHPFNVISNCTVGFPGYNNGADSGPGSILMQVLDSTDNSFYKLDTSNPSDITVTDQDGTVYHFTSFYSHYPAFPLSSITGSSQNMPQPEGSSLADAIADAPTSIVDRNGNTITIVGNIGSANYILTDTLGRKISIVANSGIPTASGGTGGPEGFFFWDSNGQQQSVTFSETNTIQAGPDVGPPIDSSAMACQVTEQQFDPPASQYSVNSSNVNALVFPGIHGIYSLQYSSSSRSYSFEFDSYSHLVKIAYPAGGYSRYDYTITTYPLVNGPITCVWGEARVNHRYECPEATGSSSGCSHENTTTYDYGDPGVASFATTTCPFGGDFLLPLATYVTVTDPLGTKTVHCFDEFPDSTPALAPAETDIYKLDASGNIVKHIHNDFMGSYSGYFPFPIKTTTILPPSLSSYVQYSYDTVPEVVWGPDLAALRNNQLTMYPITNVTEIDQFGFDNALLQRTISTYWYSGHIWDKVHTSTSTDPVTGKSATTTNNYDGIGNLQSRTVQGSDTHAYTTTYTPLDSYGRPTQITDPRGAVTKLSYSNVWNENTCSPGDSGSTISSSQDTLAYLTSETNALNQITSYTYDSCSGHSPLKQIQMGR